MALRFDLPARAAGRLPHVWSHLPTPSRTLYLTFDDGPSAATDAVLDVLRHTESQGSFFVLGEHLTSHDTLLRRMQGAGHTVGSHGWRHTDPWRTRDADRWTSADVGIEAVLGTPARWLRPPYGHLTYGLWRHARATGRHIALWDLMTRDFDRRRPITTIVEDVRRRVRPGSIVVLHDGPPMAGRIEPLVEEVVPALRRDGWTLAPLPDQPPGGRG